ETRGLNQPDSGSADVWPAKWVDGQRLGRCHSSGGLAQRAGNAIWRRLVVANGAGRCDCGRCMAYPAKRLTAVTARDGAAGAAGGRGTCRDERWRTGSVASAQPCASPALRRDLGGWFTAAAVLYASGERPLAASRYLYHDALLPRGALRRGRRAADRDNQYALYCWHKRAVAGALCPAVVVQMCAGHDDGGNCAGESVFSCATLSPGGRAGTTDFYQDDTGRGGAGRAGTGGRQPVRDLGTLLTRLNNI